MAELHATKRLIKRQHCLQRASNDLPPGALTRLYGQLPGIGGQTLCKAAPAYHFMVGRAQKRAAKRPQLEKTQQPDGHILYSTPDSAQADKAFYILFSGQDGQFFVPLSVLLFLLPDGPKDVLVIRSGIRFFYIGGVEGLGGSAFDVSKVLKNRYKTDVYKRVVVLGLSASGLFAMRVAEFLRADVAVGFAALYPNEGFRLSEAVHVGAPAFDPICACRPAPCGRVVNVVAVKNEYDVLSAYRLKKMRPKLLVYHLLNQQEHNVLHPMLRFGYARWFLRMATAENGAVISGAAAATYVYGRYFVRAVRRLFGVQKIQSWYLRSLS